MMKQLFEMLTFKCVWGMRRDSSTPVLAFCCLMLWIGLVSAVISIINLFN